jgi:ABC-2 type transport system permease protein
MTAALRSELLKQRTTRTNLALLGWLVALTLLVVGLHVASFSTGALARHDDELRILGLGTTLGALFAALLGALSVTAEFRTGTIRPTLLVTPRRTRVLAAKVLAGLLAGAGVGLLAAALTAGAEAAGLAVRGVDVALDAGDYARLLAGGAAAAALLAAIGVGVGAAARNQVATVVALCVWMLLLEPLLLGDVPAVAKYAPEAAAGAVTGAIQSQTAGELASPGLGAALLIAYAAAAGLLGALSLNRRDVD